MSTAGRTENAQVAVYLAYAAQPGHRDPRDDLLIPLTRNEIRRLFTGLRQQLPSPRTQMHRSRWRRRHQATAQACHYRRRALTVT